MVFRPRLAGAQVRIVEALRANDEVVAMTGDGGVKRRTVHQACR